MKFISQRKATLHCRSKDIFPIFCAGKSKATCFPKKKKSVRHNLFDISNCFKEMTRLLRSNCVVFIFFLLKQILSIILRSECCILKASLKEGLIMKRHANLCIALMVIALPRGCSLPTGIDLYENCQVKLSLLSSLFLKQMP